VHIASSRGVGGRQGERLGEQPNRRGSQEAERIVQLPPMLAQHSTAQQSAAWQAQVCILPAFLTLSGGGRVLAARAISGAQWAMLCKSSRGEPAAQRAPLRKPSTPACMPRTPPMASTLNFQHCRAGGNSRGGVHQAGGMTRVMVQQDCGMHEADENHNLQ
jgi:hypothetical protein